MTAGWEDARFVALVRERSPALLSYAYRLTGSAQDAEDLLQDVLIRTALAWGRVRKQDNPEGYVRVALARGAINGGRRRREIPSSSLPEPPAAAPDDRDALWEVVCSLPPRQRAVLVLRYYEALSEREIATVLEISAGTVKSQASRGLVTLRSLYVEETL